MIRPFRALFVALLLSGAFVFAASAQQAVPGAAPPPGAPAWTDSAELGYVLISGNSQSATLGFKNTLAHKWDGSGIEIKAGAVRASTTTTTRTAVGTPTDFDVIEDETTDLTAENYYLAGRYDRKFSPRLFWFTGAGWNRNRFAGIENRVEAAAGLGNVWADTPRRKFSTDYAVSYTGEDHVVESADGTDNFPGLRMSSHYNQLIGAATTYVNETVLDENLDDTSDLRVNMLNSVAVAMSKKLALKVSLQWLYDNQPALTEVPLIGGVPPDDKVQVPLEELDTIFTTSLVVTFQ